MEKLTVLFYPDRVDDDRISMIYRMLLENPHVKYHNNPRKPHDAHVFWSYTGHSIIPDGITLNAPNVINRGCWNIGKQKVNDVFNDISIDPLTYKGLCVEKYDRQGKHKYHRVVSCPVKPKKDYIYQRFIEDREDGCYIRYRVHYAGGVVCVRKVYQKEPISTHQGGMTSVVIDKRELFTEEQERRFNLGCKKFGFDLGDVDVMNDGGVPIVIDVNNVAGGGMSTLFSQLYNDRQTYGHVCKKMLNFISKCRN